MIRPIIRIYITLCLKFSQHIRNWTINGILAIVDLKHICNGRPRGKSQNTIGDLIFCMQTRLNALFDAGSILNGTIFSIKSRQKIRLATVFKPFLIGDTFLRSLGHNDEYNSK